MKKLFKELEELTRKTPNSTHYFNFSRREESWIFRFQQIHVDGKTKSFKGKNPKKVLKEAVEYLKEYKNEIERLKENTEILCG